MSHCRYRYTTLLLVGALASCLPGCHRSTQAPLAPAIFTAKQAGTPVDKALVDADNDFGFRLFGKMAQKDADKNLFISPPSVALALDMVYNGAKGETAKGMAQALGLKGMTPEKVNQANAALMASLSEPDPRVELAIADSFWAKKNFRVAPEFNRVLQQFYGAEVEDLSSADNVNAWVKDHTRGKITDIVSSQTSRYADTLLVNAIYFKGLWAEPFKAELTKDEPFNLLTGQSKTVKMMHQSREYNYFEGDGIQMVRLLYGAGRLSMVLMLPKKGASADYRAFLGKLTEGNWKLWYGHFLMKEGSIAVPHFRADYASPLKGPLADLGMDSAFSEGADFSGIAPHLVITEVIHKTFVEVTEEGTEAAAATAVPMAAGLKPASDAPFEMILDHPFACAIVDDKTGAILFLGSIAEPN